MADDAVSSTSNDGARRAAEDAARAQAQQAQQAQQQGQAQGADAPKGVDAAGKTRDVVAGASAVNELQGAQGQALLTGGASGAATNGASPVEPKAGAGSVDGVYKSAGATPPDRESDFSKEIFSHGDQEMRSAMIDEVAKKAGVEPVGDPSPFGKTSEEKIRTESARISGDLVRNMVNTGKIQSQEGVKEKDLTDAEKAGLKDPKTRAATADQIGDRIARERSLTSAVGGPENLKKLEQAWSSTNQEDRTQMRESAKVEADKAHEVKSVVANVALLATGVGEGAAAVRAGAMGVKALAAEGRAAAALKAGKDVIAKGVDAVKGLFGAGAKVEAAAAEKVAAKSVQTAEKTAAEKSAAGERARLVGAAREDAAAARLEKSGLDVQRANLDVKGAGGATDFDLVMNTRQGRYAVNVGGDAKALSNGAIDEAKVKETVDRFRRAQEIARDVDGPFRADGAGAKLAFPKGTDARVIERFEREVGRQNVLLF